MNIASILAAANEEAKQHFERVKKLLGPPHVTCESQGVKTGYWHITGGVIATDWAAELKDWRYHHAAMFDTAEVRTMVEALGYPPKLLPSEIAERN